MLRAVEERLSDNGASHEDLLLNDFGYAEDLHELLKIVDNHARKQLHPYRRRGSTDEVANLTNMHTMLSRRLAERSFPSDMYDDIIKSIGFYLRVCDVVGAEFESVLEEAIISAANRQWEDEILDSVSVIVKAENREQAIREGARHIGKRRLSNAELRTIAESDTEEFIKFSELERYSDRDRIIREFLDNPDRIEEGLNFTEMEPSVQYQGLRVRTDFLARDSDDVTTFVEVVADPSEDLSEEVSRLDTFLNAADSPDNGVRGIVVVPDRITNSGQMQAAAEYHNIDICVV